MSNIFKKNDRVILTHKADIDTVKSRGASTIIGVVQEDSHIPFVSFHSYNYEGYVRFAVDQEFLKLALEIDDLFDILEDLEKKL